MASITLSGIADRFPDGTSVSVYRAEAAKDGQGPAGSVVTSASVAGSRVAFSGLADSTRYVAYALVGGEHRYIRFATPAAAGNVLRVPSVSDGALAIQVEGEAQPRVVFKPDGTYRGDGASPPSVESVGGATYSAAVQQIASDRVRVLQAIGDENFWGADFFKIPSLPGGGTATGDTASGSPTVSNVNNLGIVNGDTITGAGIPAGTTVTSGGGTATLTLSQNATATATGVTLTFTHLVSQLNTSAIYRPFLSVDSEDAAVTRTGAGWSALQVQAAAYGGSYRYSTTAGDKQSWTSPAGTTRVGLRTAALANGGIHKVTIDGDATLANRLQTAQQMVDRGRLASSALVANGGTLSPTDRVLDTFASATAPTTTLDYDRHVPIADNLTAGAHTVELTVTGYQNTAATGARGSVSAFTYATASTTRGTPNAELLVATRIASQLNSAWEYAHEFNVSGGAATFIGNVHGYEAQTAFAVTVDGRSFTGTVGEIAWGDRVEIVRDSSLRHPNSGAGATNVATVRTYYRVDERGMDIVHRTTWLVAGTLSRSYAAMFPLDGGLFSTAQLVGAASTPTLDMTVNDGTYRGGLAADGAQAMGGGIVAKVVLIDRALSVDNFAQAAPLNVSVEDRVPASVNTGDLSKLYIVRVGPTTPVTTSNGMVMFSAARYTVTV